MAERIKWGAIMMHLLAGNALMLWLLKIDSWVFFICLSIISVAVQLCAFRFIRSKTSSAKLFFLALATVVTIVFVGNGTALLIEKMIEFPSPILSIFHVLAAFVGYGVLATSYSVVFWVFFVPATWLFFFWYRQALAKAELAPSIV